MSAVAQGSALPGPGSLWSHAEHALRMQVPLHLVQWAAMFETPDSLEIEEGDDITECSPLTRGMWTQMANLTVKSIQTT